MMVMFSQLNKGKNKNLRPLQYKKKGKSKKNKVLFGDHHSETGIRHMFFEKNASKSASSVQNCGKSSQSTKSYDKVYNKAIYWGPLDGFQRDPDEKDYDQMMNDQSEEFRMYKLQLKSLNQPQFFIEDQCIIDQFSGFPEDIFQLYSNKWGFEDKYPIKEVQDFIKSEVTRIGILYFHNLNDVEVVPTIENEHLELNIKNSWLLCDKYNENYVSDLIDPCKDNLAAYLFNFISDEHFSNEYSQMVEEQKNKTDVVKQSGNKRSERLLKRKIQKNHLNYKQYYAVFMNNECYEEKDGQGDDEVLGNTCEDIIKTCWKELGFKWISINSANLKRTKANLNKYFIESTQSQRMNFPTSDGITKQNKTVMLLEDVDNISHDESSFLPTLAEFIKVSKVPIILTSHKKYCKSDII